MRIYTGRIEGKFSPVLLAALGVLSALGYGHAVVGLRGWSGAADVLDFLGVFGVLFALYFAAAWIVGRSASKSTPPAMILGFAALFRLILVFAGLPPASLASSAAADLTSKEVSYQRYLLYDQDVWRYLWDGHLWSRGIDPYRFSPEEIEDRAMEGEIDPAILDTPPWAGVFENLAYRDYLSVYPPLAQLFFRALHAPAPGSVLLLKLALAAVDLGTCWLLALLLKRLGRAPGETLLYAWNPLAIKEIAGSGHVDALAIFGITAAVYLVLSRREGVRRWSLVALAAAVLSKIAPVVLAAVFLRRVRWRAWWLLPVCLIVGYLPFHSSLSQVAGSYAAYAREWVFNPGSWALVRAAGEGLAPGWGAGAARASWLLIFAAVWSWVTWRDLRNPQWKEEPERAAIFSFLILAAFLLPSAAVMPWYLLWALPLAVVCRSRAWIALTALSLLSYLIYIDEIERSWWRWLEHGTAWTLLALDLRRWRRQGRL